MAEKDWDSPWTIEFSRERLAEFAHDQSFHCLMRLARHVNALRFAQVALVHANNEGEVPIAFRARPSAFFYTGSVLYEALSIVPELREHFASNPHWERSFGRFGDDEAVRALTAKGSDLQRLRNHIGYHVLPMVTERSLPTLDLPDYVLVRGVGKQVGNLYYELADVIALHYLFDAPAAFSTLLEEFELRGEAITKLLLDFLAASDILIPRVLEQWKAKLTHVTKPPSSEL
jgi:hypothetical protein